MLDFAKKCLRIRRDNTAFDDEVADLIAACKADLRKHGVVKTAKVTRLSNRPSSCIAKAISGTVAMMPNGFRKAMKALQTV